MTTFLHFINKNATSRSFQSSARRQTRLEQPKVFFVEKCTEYSDQKSKKKALIIAEIETSLRSRSTSRNYIAYVQSTPKVCRAPLPSVIKYIEICEFFEKKKERRATFPECLE